MLIDEPGINELTGTRYWSRGFVMEIGDYEDGYEYASMLWCHEGADTVLGWECMSLIGKSLSESPLYDYMMDGIEIRVYYMYLGFSDIREETIAYLESYEEMG